MSETNDIFNHSNPITLGAILKRNKVDKKQHCEIEDAVLNLKRVWLDSMRITDIDNLEIFSKLTHLYLQNNFIRTVQNLECVGKTLQHLNLHGNLIEDFGDSLICLDSLMSLDISSNKLNVLNYRNLPGEISFLNYLDNPVTDSVDSEQLIEFLSNLKMLNNEIVDEQEEEEGEAEGEENEAEKENDTVPLHDLCKQLKDDSKFRQSKQEEDHNKKIATLVLIKNSKDCETHGTVLSELNHQMRNSHDFSTRSGEDNSVHNLEDIRSHIPSPMSPPGTPISRKQDLPPLVDRPVSSQSLTRTPGTLSKVKPLEKSQQKLKQHNPLTNPKQKLQSPNRTLKPVNCKMAPEHTETSVSLRQPLDVALVNTDELDTYLMEVRSKFADLRSECKDL